MLHGFMYLTAIIDVYSRSIMAWGLHNTLDKENSIEVLRLAAKAHGTPEIINSDQGSQYTSSLWLSTCEGFGIRVSMDGRGRCKDNIWIERFWRTIKTEYVYINPEDNVPRLRQGIRDYIEYYNNRRSHQGINHQIPREIQTCGMSENSPKKLWRNGFILYLCCTQERTTVKLYAVVKEMAGASSPAHFYPRKDSGSHCLLSAWRV